MVYKIFFLLRISQYSGKVATNNNKKKKAIVKVVFFKQMQKTLLVSHKITLKKSFTRNQKVSRKS